MKEERKDGDEPVQSQGYGWKTQDLATLLGLVSDLKEDTPGALCIRCWGKRYTININGSVWRKIKRLWAQYYLMQHYA